MFGGISLLDIIQKGDEMNKKIFVIVAFALTLHSLAGAQAAIAESSEKPKIEVAAPISDKTNYQGDRVKFQYARSVSKVDMTKEDKPVTHACAPAFTTLRGIGTLSVVKGDGTKITAPVFVVTLVGPVGNNNVCGKDVVKLEDVVVIEQSDIDSMPPDRYGLTFGTLIVPFKYHLGGSESFSGSASVGGYVGYRQEKSGFLGLDVQYVAFIGASNVPVSKTTNGTTTTENMFGVSYGIGILGTVKGSFHMGIILGADRVNSSADYIDNGKPWIAVELGYAFSN